MIQLDEKMVSSEIKKLVPVLGRDNAEKISRAYLLADEDTKKRIFELLDTIKAGVFSDKDLRGAVLREPPPPSESNGELNIGHTLYGRKKLHPYLMKKDSLLTHMGIFGSSGYGKTNLAYSMIEQLSNEGVPVIVFDFSKRNYKDLISTPLRDKIDLYTLGRNVAPFKFNPLKPPPGIQLSQWMKEFATIFDHAYWLLGGGRHVILKALDNVYMENKNPRLQDLKSWMTQYGDSSMPARERNWVATAERPLDSLCFKEIGEIFDCKEGVLPSEFFTPGRITILELDALDINDKTFVIEILLQWIRDWLLVSGEKEKLQGVIILEEAHHVLNREKSRRIGSETVMELIFREVRELGMGIIYVDQHPSLVSYPALGNTSTHVYMNLGLDTKQSSDIQDASNMLGLDDEEQPYLRQLPIGHGFMMCRHSLHPPFLTEFPKFPMKKGAVSDEDIAQLMSGKILKEDNVEEVEEVPVTLPEDIDEQGMKIVESLGQGRGSFASQIYTNTKMSGKTFEKHVKKVIDQGLAGMKKAKIGRSVLHFYFLTPAGDAVFDANFDRKEKVSEKDVTPIVSLLEEVGWMFDRDGKKLIFKEGNKKLTVIIENSTNREKIKGDLRDTPYFICMTEGVRNCLLQEAAKLSHEKGPLTIFVATPEKFAKKADFERVDFR